MSADKNILDELGTISPVVAGIGHAATYSVPDGYFEGFASAIIRRIATETAFETGESLLFPAVLTGLHELPAYTIPTGFFEGFAEKLMRRIKAEESASPREELEILSPLLSRLNKKEPFTTPTGYFSELPGSLVAELQALRFVNDELKKDEPEISLSPRLNGLKTKQAYSIPEGYFDTFASHVLSGIALDAEREKRNTEEVKVVSINKGRTPVRNWMKYAVAAALTGLLVTAGIRVYYHHDAVTPSNDNSIAKVSDQEILNYLENQNEPLADVAVNDAQDINDNDVKDFLGDVPDAELQKYVDEDGSSKDPLTN